MPSVSKVKTATAGLIKRIKRIMTVLEQRFMEWVPAKLRGIEEQMKRIADALEKLAETKNDSK